MIPNSGNPVTAANAAWLKAGMTYEQVLKLLATPMFCRDCNDTCFWSRCELCDNQLFLTFERGVLVAKRSK